LAAFSATEAATLRVTLAVEEELLEAAAGR